MSLSDNIAIQIKNLGKKYYLKSSESWALKNIDLSIETGSALGIVGHNGAGKSTLLKILSGLTKPSTGSFKYRGSLTSLLEIGTGFHPDLSGIENIYLSAALNGMNRKKIQKKLSQIIEFSGISENYIYQPIKHYSSGMKVRLGFSVAAHVDSDILIVDEILAVGDRSFQEKCFRNMESQINQNGRTIIFVSHNLFALKQLCPKAILLEQGELTQFGDSKKICETYIRSSLSGISSLDLSKRKDRKGSGEVRITKLKWKTEILETGKPAILHITYQGVEDLKDFNIKISINGEDGRFLSPLSMHSNNFRPTIMPASGDIEIHIEKVPWMKGKYYADIRAIERGVVCDDLRMACKFEVHGGHYIEGGDEFNSKKSGVFIPHEWNFPK